MYLNEAILSNPFMPNGLFYCANGTNPFFISEMNFGVQFHLVGWLVGCIWSLADRIRDEC